MSDHPIPVTDPVRHAELVAEFQHKRDYVMRSYIRSKGPFEDFLKRYNHDLAKLRKAMKTGDSAMPRRSRLHPFLEIAINGQAIEFARERTGAHKPDLECCDIELAAQHVARHAKSFRGRPKDPNLVRHVRGLMALIQQYLGRPVYGAKERNSVYDPHLNGAAAHMLQMLNDWGARLTATQLQTLLENARTDYAGKWMRFEEFFPLYGGDGSILAAGQRLADGRLVESFTMCRPIFLGAPAA